MTDPIPTPDSTDSSAEAAPARPRRRRTAPRGAPRAEASPGPDALPASAAVELAEGGEWLGKIRLELGPDEPVAPAAAAPTERTDPAARPRRGVRSRYGRPRANLPREEAPPNADAEDAIPVFSRQARVGVDATDPRRRERAAQRGRPDDDLEGGPKLHKVLADSGVGSRRDMEALILAGRISVNGQPAHIGQRVGPHDVVRVNGRPLHRRVQKQAPKVLLYHKTPGEICSRDDPGQRSTVFDRLPRLKGARWVAVGRLDFNTEGLLVFTTSGELANRLMHPRYGWEREYAVRVLGRVDDAVRAQLLAGVPLEDGPAALLAIDDVGGDGANHWYRVVIGEGRNREVRRIFEAVGLTVSRLVRIRFGPIGLPRGLVRGRWVELAPSEVDTLTALLKQADRSLSRSAPVARAASDEAPQGEDFEGAEAAQAALEGAEVLAELDDLDQVPQGERPPRAPDQAPLAERGRRRGSARRGPPSGLPGELPRSEALPRKPRIDRDDDEWQPSSADAHQSGILKAVRQSTRDQQRFPVGSALAQTGLGLTPKPPGGGPRRGNRRKPGGGGGFAPGPMGSFDQRYGASTPDGVSGGPRSGPGGGRRGPGAGPQGRPRGPGGRRRGPPAG